MRKNNFWAAKIAAIFVSTGLCLGLMEQSQTIHADLANQPARSESCCQEKCPSTNVSSCCNDNTNAAKLPPLGEPGVIKKDFSDSLQNSNSPVETPAPNANYHFDNLPTSRVSPNKQGGAVNPDSNVTNEPSNAKEQAATSSQASLSTNSESAKNESSKQAVAKTRKPSGSKLKKAHKNAALRRTASRKNKKIYYANIFAPKHIASTNNKKQNRLKEENEGNFSAEVINHKGKTVGYVDHHQRVHFEKLSYFAKTDGSSSLTSFLSVLVLSVFAVIAFITAKEKF